ncbi:MAG: tetratricopeptide (TPR) repeat protein, partial [Pirellulaceae bacterium]
HLAEHLSDTNNRAESFVFPEKLNCCESTTLEELKNLDLYLEYLHAHQPEQLDEKWVESILAAAAFVGEVIRQNSPRQFQWFDYDSAVALGPSYAEFVGDRELAVYAALISLRGTAILPIYRVAMFVLEGEQHSTFAFAKAEIQAPVEDRKPSDAIQLLIDAEQNERQLMNEDEWEVVEELDTNDPQFDLVEVGFRLLDAGQDDDARENFVQRLDSHPADGRAHKGLGDCHYFAGDAAAAVTSYDRAIEFDDASSDTFLARGAANAELGRFDESLADLDRALQDAEQVLDVQMERASVLLRMERFDEAIASYSDILLAATGESIAGESVDSGMQLQVLAARANAHYEANQFDEALADIAKAELLGSHDVDLFITAARIHELRGDFRKSIAAYEKAIHCDDRNADGINGLAWILATVSDPKLQDGARAKQLATEALHFAGQDDRHIVLDTLSAACARAGEFDSAIDHLRTALETVDDDELRTEYETRLRLYQTQTPYEC